GDGLTDLVNALLVDLGRTRDRALRLLHQRGQWGQLNAVAAGLRFGLGARSRGTGILRGRGNIGLARVLDFHDGLQKRIDSNGYTAASRKTLVIYFTLAQNLRETVQKSTLTLP